jgi:site-specific DNA recombinase
MRLMMRLATGNSRARAREPHGGVIVEEFFDIGLSRSLPWTRRPRARPLIESFDYPDRGFEAVVIGEPARAFYGNQFGLTFPVFVHYKIGLWCRRWAERSIPAARLTTR